MIIQQYLLLLFASLCFAQNSNNLVEAEYNGNVVEKAFTAECQGLDGSGCIYSVVFTAANQGINCQGTARLTINGVGDPFTVNVGSIDPPLVKNFEVYKDDQVLLYFEPTSANACNYGIYDEPNGADIMFVGNTFTNFELYNPCKSNCVFEIVATSLWNPSLTITITVNGGSPTIFSGTQVSFPVQKGDILTFDFFTPFKGGITDVSANINDITSGPSVTFFKWYESAYFSPMTFINPCSNVAPTPPLPPSPFGGDLYPITQEQIELFLKDVSDPSLIWYYTTLNYDYSISEPSKEESTSKLLQ